MRRKTKVAVWSVVAFLFVGSGIAASLAWFDNGTNEVDVDVTGSVVEEYFHCGDGTAAKPFVITRPIHYYHLVEFFQRKTNLSVDNGVAHFGSDYLYFQVGYPLNYVEGSENPDTSLYVYNYDDQGIYQGTANDPSYAKTLNMAYYSGTNALMPIGTNEVPFVGSFDGGRTSSGGITISNLNICCSETVLVGDTETLRTTGDAGVFGYVADQDGSGNPTRIENAYFEKLTIDLTDISATVGLSDTGVSHADAHANEPCVGYIVGHLCTYENYDEDQSSNASPIHDVYVNNAKIVGGAGVSCGFGYVGRVDHFDDPSGAGTDVGDEITELGEVLDGVGQGGSMDMSDLYLRLRYYYRSMSGKSGYLLNRGGSASTFSNGAFDNNGGNPNYAWRVNRDIALDGTETINSSETTNQMLIHSYAGNGDDKKLGTVAIWNRHNKELPNTGNPGIEDIMFLVGGKYCYGDKVQEKERSTTLITCDNTNFLTATGTGSNNFGSAGQNSASRWAYDGSSSKIQTTVNQTPVYLRNNSGSLQLTTASGSATTWSIVSNNGKISIRDGSYELTCSNAGTWSLRNAIIGYKLRDSSTHYIGASGSGTVNAASVSSSNALIWNYTNNAFVSTDNRYLVYNNGVKVSTTNSQAFTSSAGAPPFSTYSRLSYRTGGFWSTTYYVRIQSSGVDTTTSAGTSNNIYSEAAYNWTSPVYDGYSEITYGPDTETVSYGGMEYSSDNTSIIPLNVVQDGEFTTKQNYYAAKKNNGYLVSGASYQASGDFYNANGVISQSNIRVSAYEIKAPTSTSSIEKSYNRSTKVLSNIRTIHYSNGSLADEELTNSEKSGELYQKSVTALKATLDAEVDAYPTHPYAYGLHFMDSSISKDRIVRSDYAIVNGKSKTNYPLPVDSIDFNLHENHGVVNFFAGTYFSGNNTFFSLHHINRNGNEIDNIKEIAEIYSDEDEDHSYVYKYADGTYSQAFDMVAKKTINQSGVVTATDYTPNMSLASKPSTYSTLVFSTSQITVTDSTISSNLNNSSGNKNTLYYFEIPIHKGEYALGSVPGKDGAYLLFLDVGTKGNLGDYNTNNMIGNGPLFTQIGFSTGTYFINSVFNVAYVIPDGSDKDNFSITISVRTDVEYEDSDDYTCLDIVIVNHSEASFSLNVLLSDNNDDPTDTLPYIYSIKYNESGPTVYATSNIFKDETGTGNSLAPSYSFSD